MLYTDVFRATAGRYGWTDQPTFKPFGHPVITVYFEDYSGGWIPVRSELDPGADITVLPKQIADKLMQYSSVEPTVLSQVAPGSQVAAEIFMAKAAFEGNIFMTPVLALDGDPTPLIGRANFLDNFQVTLKRDSFDVIPY